MKLRTLAPLLALNILLTSTAFALSSLPTPKTTPPSGFDEEGLSDEDTEIDLEAENLPTTNKFGYLWEQFRGAAVTTFTFNAEKKAAQYRLRLHGLDRKLAACSEIGDTECIKKIEENMQKLNNRTEKYIAKREELKEQLLTRFQDWRAKRESRIKTLEQKAAKNEKDMTELLKKRSIKRIQAIQNRKSWRKRVKENLKKSHNLLQEEIEQNQEQLIEARSGNLKNKLDQTREKVQLHQDEFNTINTP